MEKRRFKSLYHCLRTISRAFGAQATLPIWYVTSFWGGAGESSFWPLASTWWGVWGKSICVIGWLKVYRN